MIITKETCKRLIRVTDSDNDALIEELLPIAQEDLCDYLNNYFEDSLVTYWGSYFSFVRGTPDTITDNESEFLEHRFAAGMDIFVDGETSNRGIYEIATAAAGTLTLTSSNRLVSMSYADTDNTPGSHVISRVVWPQSLGLVVARMVNYLMMRDKPDGELSKSIDGAVVAYDRTYAYPREILSMANKYRRPAFV